MKFVDAKAAMSNTDGCRVRWGNWRPSQLPPVQFAEYSSGYWLEDEDFRTIQATFGLLGDDVSEDDLVRVGCAYFHTGVVSVDLLAGLLELYDDPEYDGWIYFRVNTGGVVNTGDASADGTHWLPVGVHLRDQGQPFILWEPFNSNRASKNVALVLCGIIAKRRAGLPARSVIHYTTGQQSQGNQYACGYIQEILLLVLQAAHRRYDDFSPVNFGPPSVPLGWKELVWQALDLRALAGDIINEGLTVVTKSMRGSADVTARKACHVWGVGATASEYFDTLVRAEKSGAATEFPRETLLNLLSHARKNMRSMMREASII